MLYLLAAYLPVSYIVGYHFWGRGNAGLTPGSIAMIALSPVAVPLAVTFLLLQVVL